MTTHAMTHLSPVARAAVLARGDSSSAVEDGSPTYPGCPVDRRHGSEGAQADAISDLPVETPAPTVAARKFADCHNAVADPSIG